MSQLTPLQKAHIAAAAKARWAKLKAAHPAKASGNLEVLPPGKSAFNALLKGGDDAATAKQLNKLFKEAQNGMRRVIALGLFAWQVKERQLKHGEFGKWLADHCPALATQTEDGRPRPSRALQGYMDLTKSVLESVGFPTIEKYLDEAEKFSGTKALNHGGFLLIADKKVPEAVKPLRDKICELVDGKTQRQLFLEFKQADDADEPKPKRGRLKGQGGATIEQRANAEQLAAEERITEKKLKAEEVAHWLTEQSDDKGFGELLGTPELIALDLAMETARGYIRHGGAQ